MNRNQLLNASPMIIFSILIVVAGIFAAVYLSKEKPTSTPTPTEEEKPEKSE